MSKNKPYIEEKLGENVVIRTFSPNILSEELNWHRDHEDRFIELLDENIGWKLQFENELPKEITKKTIFIQKNQYHRLIKGKNILKIKIIKIL